jgi:hypothetical protein
VRDGPPALSARNSLVLLHLPWIFAKTSLHAGKHAGTAILGVMSFDDSSPVKINQIDLQQRELGDRRRIYYASRGYVVRLDALLRWAGMSGKRRISEELTQEFCG